MPELSAKERMEYCLAEARRQYQQGAMRMALSWAYHARRLAGDESGCREEADALMEAARQAH